MTQKAILNLAKENFKFSSAHFLIFDEKHAERLHGHNYRVQVSLETSLTAEIETRGFFIDFKEIKSYMLNLMQKWDEMVLLPAKHPDMKIEANGPSLHVHFRDRYYVFPKNEVVLLEVTNASVENLARLLSEDIFKVYQSRGLEQVKVTVEETSGQSATVITAG